MNLKPARFLDPKSDIVFKKIFGQHPDLMMSFLNGVLPLQEDQLIEEVTYLTPEQTPRIPAMKNTIVDVKCKDNKGRIFIVEMQLHWTRSFQQRLLFGASRAYVQQLDAGDEYSSLCPVFGLGIINEIFEPGTQEWFHHYRTVNVRDSSKVLEGLELVFLELPKFTPQTNMHRKMGVLWMRFLKEINNHLVEVPEEFSRDPDISKALELTQESSYSRTELDAYDRYWDAVSVEKTFYHDALEIGREQGLAEGIEVGELKAKRDLAVKLLATGMERSQVASLTGLGESDL